MMMAVMAAVMTASRALEQKAPACWACSWPALFLLVAWCRSRGCRFVIDFLMCALIAVQIAAILIVVTLLLAKVVTFCTAFRTSVSTEHKCRLVWGPKIQDISTWRGLTGAAASCLKKVHETSSVALSWLEWVIGSSGTKNMRHDSSCLRAVTVSLPLC